MNHARSSLGSLLPLTARVLRSPADLVAPGVRLENILVGLVTLIVLAGGLFGVVIGSYRGGVQQVFAALKVPLVFVLPLLLVLPAVRALYVAAGVPLRYERLVVASLVGVARAALLAAALGPALWLLYSVRPDYHFAVMCLCATLVVTGGVGLLTIARLLPDGGKLRGLAHMGALVLAGVVFAQSGWVLRPFLVRPRGEVTFVRPIEADVFSSMGASYRSSRGRYDGWEAEEVPLWSEGDDARVEETERP